MLDPVDVITVRTDAGERMRLALDDKGEVWRYRQAGRTTGDPKAMSKWVHVQITRSYAPYDQTHDDSKFVKFVYSGYQEDLGFITEQGTVWFQGAIPWKVSRATSWTEE